jgi:hypothetical protein
MYPKLLTDGLDRFFWSLFGKNYHDIVLKQLDALGQARRDGARSGQFNRLLFCYFEIECLRLWQ